MWCRQCPTAAIYRAIKLLPGQTDRPLPQLLTYGTNGAWKVLQAVLIGTTPLTRTMAWCRKCTTAATSLGKKILPCNMDPPTVPLLSSAVSHLPPTPSLQKNSVGTCQTNYDPRGAAGLSHRNALLNGIPHITWMAGLTTGQTLHIISNNISVSKHNHLLIHVVLLTMCFLFLYFIYSL